MEPKALAMEIAKILDDKKASRLKVLRVHDLTVMADYFVIASGTSSTHVKSLAEEVEFKMKENFGEHVFCPYRKWKFFRVYKRQERKLQI